VGRPEQEKEPQRHSPLTQVGPVDSVQTRPQAPQFVGSVFVSTQVPPQHERPPEHGGSHSETMHMPPTHTVPGSQMFPQVPQLVESVRVSTQNP
jgi:hypothetical protein